MPRLWRARALRRFLFFREVSNERPHPCDRPGRGRTRSPDASDRVVAESADLEMTPERAQFWRQTSSGRVEHRFEPVMAVLAILVIPVILIEESDAPHVAKQVAATMNWVIWLGFAAEFILILI